MRLAASGGRTAGRTEQFGASAAAATADGGFLLASVGLDCTCILYGAPARPSLLAVALARRPAEATTGEIVRLPVTTTMAAQVKATVRDKRGRLIAAGAATLNGGTRSSLELNRAIRRSGQYALRVSATGPEGRVAALNSTLSVLPKNLPQGTDDG